ncbi:MAG: hypothetical protein OEZ58_13505 [Gammaproteobacteria bacterium]|nr:hypothetical protein [Gammaproteobacteria bacterium]MDH5730004.1 hypothetical protein [Gammaproteobacteria bacterium]
MFNFLSGLLLCLFMSFQWVVADEISQAKFSERYDNRTLYLQNSIIGYNHVLNGKLLPAGFFGERLNPYMKQYPEVNSEFHRSINYQVSGLLLNLGSVLYYSMNKEKDKAPWISFTGLIFGISFSIRGSNQLEKAVWLYNKKTLLQE